MTGRNPDLPLKDYGGTLAYLEDLQVGDEFFVNNGHWNGKIIEVDGISKVKVLETDQVFEIKHDDHLWITLEKAVKAPKEKKVKAEKPPKAPKVRRGEGSHKAKLDDFEVLQIFDMCKSRKVTRQTAADMFNVSKSTVDQILSGRCWSHLTELNEIERKKWIAMSPEERALIPPKEPKAPVSKEPVAPPQPFWAKFIKREE